MSRRHHQAGVVGVLIVGPLVVALVLLPLVAMRQAQIAEQKRLDHEVRQALRQPGTAPKPPPPGIADDASLQAEVEVMGGP